MKFRFKKIALTVIFLIVLGAISSALVNNCRGTAHEKGPNQSVAIGQNKDVEILTEGCFLRGQDGLTLHLKADSLTPRVVLTPKSNQEKNLKLVMDNISPDLLTVDGANVLERIPREKKMVVEVSVTPAKPTAVQWKLSRVEEEFSFFVFGDNRNTYDVLEEIREDIARERPLFVINVGDLVSRGTKEQMLKHEEFANSVPVPYFTVLGNHDLEKGKRTSAEPYYEVFGPTSSIFYGLLRKVSRSLDRLSLAIAVREKMGQSSVIVESFISFAQGLARGGQEHEDSFPSHRRYHCCSHAHCYSHACQGFFQARSRPGELP
jgi:hypothetical protein